MKGCSVPFLCGAANNFPGLLGDQCESLRDAFDVALFTCEAFVAHATVGVSMADRPIEITQSESHSKELSGPVEFVDGSALLDIADSCCYR